MAPPKEDPSDPNSRWYREVTAFLCGAFAMGMTWLAVDTWPMPLRVLTSRRFLTVAAILLAWTAVKTIYQASRERRGR